MGVRDAYFEDLVTRVLTRELRIVNRHLPYKRVSLCDLEKMDIPYIVLRDGTAHLIDPRELEYLSNLLGKDKCKLLLPIIIEARQSLGEGTYIVRDRVAKRVIAEILGVEYEEEKPLIIYRPHLYKIREVVHSFRKELIWSIVP